MQVPSRPLRPHRICSLPYMHSKSGIAWIFETPSETAIDHRDTPWTYDNTTMARLLTSHFAHGGECPLQITRKIIFRPTRLHAIHDNICDRTARTFLIYASSPENYCHHLSPALARSVAQSSPPLSAELHKRNQPLQEIQLPCVSLIPIRCQRPS